MTNAKICWTPTVAAIGSNNPSNSILEYSNPLMSSIEHKINVN